jgi:nitroreductase
MTSATETAPADLHPVLADRWSPRAFDPDRTLGDAELASLLEALRWAPSAMNLQPWRYLVGRRGDETFAGLFASLAGGNQLWAGEAALLVAGVVPVVDAQGAPMALAPLELGLSVSQLVVQAQALGLHAHTMAGFDADALGARFGVPQDHRALVVVAVGALGDPARLPDALREREALPRLRKPLAEIAYAGSWGSPA